VDTERFPSPHIARQALEKGMSFPTVLNAANEVAVTLFLENKITFSHIPVLIEKALERHIPGHITSVEDVMEADAKARESVRFLLGG
jgi:1-deoxy-D-xylulose-5-phosphate reductoisomerase